jgi:recombination protein RecT
MSTDQNQQPTIQQELETLKPRIKEALPNHVSCERFMRGVQIAIAVNPELMQADRKSLFTAAYAAAQDGLMPDGRESVFLVFNTNVAKPGEQPRAIKKVQYLRMVSGILKLIRNSGELESIASRIVFEADEFRLEYGDSEAIHHVPCTRGQRGEPIGVYALARLKSGAVVREYLTRDEVEAIRNSSKAPNGPAWGGPFRLEMWRKSAIKRLSKRLPLSTDFLGRDDDEEEFETDITPRESEAAANLRKRLTEF